jgi:hypothetical protein
MGRTKAPAPQDLSPAIDTEMMSADTRATNVAFERSQEISQRFGDGAPYEQRRLVHETRFYLGQSAEAMLEAGRRLLQIKENEPHGEFLRIVEDELQLPRRTASALMAAAAKFLNPRLTANGQTFAHLSRSKLLELVTVPDDELVELAEGGTLAGHTIDEIDAMSVRELKAALRDLRERAAAKDRVITKTKAKVTELEEAEERRRNGTRDERETAQMEDLRTAGLEADMALLRLAAAVDQVIEQAATPATELAAKQTLDWVVARLAETLEARGFHTEWGGEVTPPQWMQAMQELQPPVVAQETPRRSKKG